MTTKQLKKLIKESDGFGPDSEAALNEFTAKLGEAIRTAVKDIYNNREAEGESAFGSFDIRDFLHRLVRTVKQYDLDIDEAALHDAAQNVVFSMYEGEEYSTITEEDSEERNPSLMMCDCCGRMFNDINAEIVDGDVLCPKCAKECGKIEKRGFELDEDGRSRMYNEAHGDKNNRGWRKNKGTVKKESEAYQRGDLKRKLQNGISNDSITIKDDE